MFSVRSVWVPADRRTSATFLAGSPGGQQASTFRWNQSQKKQKKTTKKTTHSQKDPLQKKLHKEDRYGRKSTRLKTHKLQNECQNKWLRVFFFFFWFLFWVWFQALLEMKASLGVGAVQQRIYLSLQPVSERSGCRGNAAAQKPRAASSILPTCLPPSLSKKNKNKNGYKMCSQVL